MEFWDTLMKGGALIPVILGSSVIGLTVFFERLWAFRGSRVFPPQIAHSLMDFMQHGSYEAAQSLAEHNRSPLSSMVAIGLKFRNNGRGSVKERMEEVGGMELAYLRKHMIILSVIATITPLLGLLGTVIGMVQVFQDVSLSTDPQIGDMADGIWVALLTTVAGLSVAIPAFLGSKFLDSRLEGMALRFEEFGLDMLAQIFPPEGSTPKSDVVEER
jgi:biopolymer transport protein ExbB